MDSPTIEKKYANTENSLEEMEKLVLVVTIG